MRTPPLPHFECHFSLLSVVLTASRSPHRHPLVFGVFVVCSGTPPPHSPNNPQRSSPSLMFTSESCNQLTETPESFFACLSCQDAFQIRQRRLATIVRVCHSVWGGHGKKKTEPNTDPSMAVTAPSFSCCLCHPGACGRGRGESNPRVWVTVDRQRDNIGANTIIDSHLCPLLEIRRDYKRKEMGFSQISFCC